MMMHMPYYWYWYWYWIDRKEAQHNLRMAQGEDQSYIPTDL